MDAKIHAKADQLRRKISDVKEAISKIDNGIGVLRVEIDVCRGDGIIKIEDVAKTVCESVNKVLEERLNDLQKLYEEL